MALTFIALASLARGDTVEAISTSSDTGTEATQIKLLITKYVESVDAADTRLAAEVWLDSPDVTFIHPLGHEHGFEQIKANIYKRLMGGLFSERKLSPRDISIHVHGDSAWAEFYWDFAAKRRTDGTSTITHGRETQVYWKEQGRWRLVHVHYSGMPFTQP
jgi:ketosteroid isomerase-like protein